MLASGPPAVRFSQPSSANSAELISRMDVPRRRRLISPEQRRLMLEHSQETRRRLARFAGRFGLTARDLRHLYVAGHMPLGLWQEFVAAGIHVPQCWIKDRYEVNVDGHRPWIFLASEVEKCLRCFDMKLDPVLFVQLPPPHWQPPAREPNPNKK